jgi:hypothetical protein
MKPSDIEKFLTRSGLLPTARPLKDRLTRKKIGGSDARNPFTLVAWVRIETARVPSAGLAFCLLD